MDQQASLPPAMFHSFLYDKYAKRMRMTGPSCMRTNRRSKEVRTLSAAVPSRKVDARTSRPEFEWPRKGGGGGIVGA